MRLGHSPSLEGKSLMPTRRIYLVIPATMALLAVSVGVPTLGADPALSGGTFTADGSLAEARSDHTATLLADGRVIVIGGDDEATIASAEVWDPAPGSFVSSGSLAQARKWHTATRSRDGRVIVIGGLGDDAGDEQDFLASAEVWDGVQGAFAPTGSMARARISHTATLLDDDSVLVVGGVVVSIVPLETAERWDPASGSFAATGSLAEARSGHTATLLPDGRVLVVGGGAFVPDGFEVRAAAEAWDPATGTFAAAGELGDARMDHTATLLADGGVLVIGGAARDSRGAVVRASAELWDPAIGRFVPTGSLLEARAHHTATLLPDGRVLVTGGGALDSQRTVVRASAELWDPATGTFGPAGPLHEGRYAHTATLLPDGRVLVVGGRGTDGALRTAEVWAP
jgi:hypothetical protein